MSAKRKTSKRKEQIADERNLRIRVTAEEKELLDAFAAQFKVPLAIWARIALVLPGSMPTFAAVRECETPKRSGTPKRDIILRIILRVDERERLDQIASRKRLPTSAWARDVLLALAQDFLSRDPLGRHPR